MSNPSESESSNSWFNSQPAIAEQPQEHIDFVRPEGVPRPLTPAEIEQKAEVIKQVTNTMSKDQFDKNSREIGRLRESLRIGQLTELGQTGTVAHLKLLEDRETRRTFTTRNPGELSKLLIAVSLEFGAQQIGTVGTAWKKLARDPNATFTVKFWRNDKTGGLEYGPQDFLEEYKPRQARLAGDIGRRFLRKQPQLRHEKREIFLCPRVIKVALTQG